MSRRFRWSRKTYRKAHHLARLLDRMGFYSPQTPTLLRRFWELWEQHPTGRDPFDTPVRCRLNAFKRGEDDDIPF